MSKIQNQDSSSDKHDFADAYDQKDASGFVDSFEHLEYRDPDYLPNALGIINEYQSNYLAGETLTILDLCSSYGLNSGFLRFGRFHDKLLDFLKYADPQDPYTHRNTPLWDKSHQIIGLDKAMNALTYGMKIGAFDSVVHQSLEDGDFSREEYMAVSKTNLIVSTGSLSYVTYRTISKILSCIGREKPLLALFWPIMGHDTRDVVKVLADNGLSVTIDPKYLWHRKFVNEDEEKSLLARTGVRENLQINKISRKGVYVSRLTAIRTKPM